MNLKKILIIFTLSTSYQLFSDSCTSCNDCNECVNLCDVNCCNDLLTRESGPGYTCNVYGKTTYVPRPQGDNLARRMIGVQDKIHKFGADKFYGVFSVATEYQRLFKNKSGVGQWFSTNGLNSMSYGAVQSTAQNNQFDINSLNFGVTGSGIINFCPRKDDIIVDFSLYLGIDEILCGAWIRLDVPFAHTRWDLQIQEVLFATGSSLLPEDLYDQTSVSAPFVSKDKPMTKAFQGEAQSEFGQVSSLNYGKICGRRIDSNVSGVRIDLGYDWVRKEHCHFATAIDFVAPVGTTPSAEYLFQPMVGDYKRSQVGLFTNYGKTFWENCDAKKTLSCYFDFLATALIGRKMERLLGLKIPESSTAQEVWSQYLTLKKFTKAGDTFTYANEIERAANITAGCIKLGTSAIVDLAILLQYDRTCLSAGLGYEFWYRSTEKIKQRCFGIKSETYGIQGVQGVVDSPESIDTQARINYVSGNDSEEGTGGVQDINSTDPTGSGLLSNDDLDYCRALAPSMYSNKIFGFVSYNWKENEWQPYILVGGEVEFAQGNRSFDQWGIIAKGGIAF